MPTYHVTGLVTSLIYLGNATEFWHVKISTCVNGVTPLTESDWDSFYAVLDDWTNTLDSAGQYVGSTQKLDDRKEDKPHTRYSNRARWSQWQTLRFRRHLLCLDRTSLGTKSLVKIGGDIHVLGFRGEKKGNALFKMQLAQSICK